MRIGEIYLWKMSKATLLHRENSQQGWNSRKAGFSLQEKGDSLHFCSELKSISMWTVSSPSLEVFKGTMLWRFKHQPTYQVRILELTHPARNHRVDALRGFLTLGITAVGCMFSVTVKMPHKMPTFPTGVPEFTSWLCFQFQMLMCTLKS